MLSRNATNELLSLKKALGAHLRRSNCAQPVGSTTRRKKSPSSQVRWCGVQKSLNVHLGNEATLAGGDQRLPREPSGQTSWEVLREKIRLRASVRIAGPDEKSCRPQKDVGSVKKVSPLRNNARARRRRLRSNYREVAVYAPPKECQAKPADSSVAVVSGVDQCEGCGLVEYPSAGSWVPRHATPSYKSKNILPPGVEGCPECWRKNYQAEVARNASRTTLGFRRRGAVRNRRGG